MSRRGRNRPTCRVVRLFVWAAQLFAAQWRGNYPQPRRDEDFGEPEKGEMELLTQSNTLFLDTFLSLGAWGGIYNPGA